MLFAPHPDDESLACSVILQRAVRARAAVRVIYVTNGEDNPWPHRVLERKWRLNSSDRNRWGKMRRAEALAALAVLGVGPTETRFLGLPDQQLTSLLTSDYEPLLKRFAGEINDFGPTHLLVPSLSDTHPDHSALGVMLRLVGNAFFLHQTAMRTWSYVVHGQSSAFFGRATALTQSKIETAKKRAAIACHQSQIKLSRRRFFAYATRPEYLYRACAADFGVVEGSIHSASRQRHSLQITVRMQLKFIYRTEPALFVLGNGARGEFRCAKIDIPPRSKSVAARDVRTRRAIALAQYRGDSYAGELLVPTTTFAPHAPVFVKLERRSWFFDEAGWIEIPPVTAHGLTSALRLAGVA
ncbi:MAG TPA: PIG-L family deacetylase [Chthoniobacterales bacterium]|nr:PIG-L family deacetylase [Chthoniobacterales bacterium]